jgi:hypothetical protein
MLSYLHASGMHTTYDALRTDSGNEDFTTDDPKAKWNGLLEKKWTSVIRLQKKVCVKPTMKSSSLIRISADHGPRVTQRGSHC